MWQILILFYFVFGAGSYIFRRILAKEFGQHNRLINAIFFVFFLLPASIILSFFFPHNLRVGWENIIFLFGGSLIWPIFYIVAFQANKKVDVSIFTIISNISPVFTLAIALPFLKESLHGIQAVGIGLLIVSGILAAFSQLKKHIHANTNGLLVCLLSAVILGVAVAYERFMLSRIDFGAYLIYGWGSQIIWSVILTHKEFRHLPFLFSKKRSRTTLLFFGTVSVLRSVAFILALKLSGSASIISAASDFTSVAVVLAAYIFLREREHMAYKWIAAGVGVFGLLLVAQ